MKIHIDDTEVFKYADWTILEECLFSDLSDAEAICVGFDRKITDEYLSQAKHLKYIVSPTTAIDHIKTKKFHIISLDPDNINHIRASSEFTLLLTLALVRKFNSILNMEDVLADTDIFGKTIGIFGYGRIGKNVATYFNSMGAKIIWNDRDFGWTKNEILEQSDIIIVAITSSGDNTNFLDYQDFHQMVRKPYIVNIARDFVINSHAMLYALVNGIISGAAIDSINKHHIFEKYLQDNSNLILTNHKAGSTISSRKLACEYVLRKLRDAV